ncbi:helix-turn-helix transcriptional regulator [Rhizomonospora bruguierae]|uniref:helix-turn-helix transcriptional regulator n=1 Tax=Rhizomonospora bruguierae TaxID=1581705 RepID=UPI001BCC76CE|nr:helix-turn-helix transcriptional regulator [Micromonospora sp. NBRC 107566]
MSSDVHSLAGLIRVWRERLVPSDVGLLSYGRRRTKGLRREELAQLAGVSSDYITRLEQGRWQTPSPQVVASLARALQLDRTEADLLYRAAGLATPCPGGISHHIPPGVQRMLARLADLPLAVFAADWTMLAATPLHDRLFLRPSPMEVPGQNLAVDMFVNKTSMVVAYPEVGADMFERAIVADLRRTASYAVDDPGFAALLETLRNESPRFVELWAEGIVAAHQSLVLTVHHPDVGDVTVDSDMLTVPDSDLRVVVLTAAAGSDAAEKLERLRTAT